MVDKSDVFLLKRNLYYYLRNEVLFDELSLSDYSYHETVTGEVLTRDATNLQRYNFLNGNLIYRAPSYPITIYRNGFEVSTDDYIVNYRDGYIVFDDGITINNVELITADYSWMTVKIVFAFNYEATDQSMLPIIAIDMENTVKSPVELGTTMSFKDRTVYFMVYARDENEKDKLISILEERFDRRIEVMINYKLEEPLTEDGFLNPDFTGVQLSDYEYSIQHIESLNLYPAAPNEIDKYSCMVETVVSSFI